MNAAEQVQFAELQISKAITAMESEEAPSIVHAMLAQTRATLALAEQKRLANLQRERAWLDRQVGEPGVGDAQATLRYNEVSELSAEIREALGLR